MEAPLRELGLDPRRVLQLAKSKQMIVWEELWHSNKKAGPTIGDAVARVMEAVANATWPPPEDAGLTGRSRAFWRGLVSGVEQVETSIAPPS
jgi:hypothetical protein